MSPTVVVIGPSTYLGTVLVPLLLGNGYRVIGVSPRPPIARMFFPEESEALTIATPHEAPGLIADSEEISIVNLAEIADVPSQELLSRDRRTRARWRRGVASTASEIVSRGARKLIHVSSPAVFGPTLTATPAPVRVRWRPMADPDAESQLLTEHMMERLAKKRGCELAIVRLGNVIGPGSPVWVAGLAQRIMDMQPVGYAGVEGCSNATDVANSADYVVKLVERPPDALSAFGTFHHLAEFSSHRWPEVLDVISDAVGLPWNVAAGRAMPERKSPAQVGKSILKAGARSAPGAYLRAGVSLLPDRALDLLPQRGQAPPPQPAGGAPPAGPGDVSLLETLSAEHEFASHTLGDWKPGLEFREACDRIAEWLQDSAYSLLPEPSSSS